MALSHSWMFAALLGSALAVAACASEDECTEGDDCSAAPAGGKSGRGSSSGSSGKKSSAGGSTSGGRAGQSGEGGSGTAKGGSDGGGPAKGGSPAKGGAAGAASGGAGATTKGGAAGKGGSGSKGGTGGTGAAGTGGTGSGAGGEATVEMWEEGRALCVQQINDYRATIGYPPLVRWTEAEKCADSQAENDAKSGVPHQGFQKIGGCGMGQNECPGYASIPGGLLQCLGQMWAEGPTEDGSWDVPHGHYMNMRGDWTLNGYTVNFTRVACGFAQAAGGGVWSVQNFQ